MTPTIHLALGLLFIASLFGMAANLIARQVKGWGWFLIVVAIVVVNTKIKVGHTDSSVLQSPVHAADENSTEVAHSPLPDSGAKPRKDE